MEENYKIKAKAYQCQVTDKDAVRETIATIIEEFGKIDCMIVNHGIPSQASILDGSYDDWKKVMDIDLNGSFYVAKVDFVLLILILGNWRTLSGPKDWQLNFHCVNVRTYCQLSSITRML